MPQIKPTPPYKPGLVTVIIPTYNYAIYLSDAINSVLRQTYPYIEIIVVDDGSSDNTKSIVKKFNSVHYIYQKNAGLASARNRAKELAQGEYIFLLDADDMIEKTCVQELVTCLVSQPQNIGYAYSQLKYFEASDYTTHFPEFDSEKIKKQNIVHASSLFKRNVYMQFDYDSRIKVFEDWDYYLTLCEKGIYGALLDKPLVLYRKHKNADSMLNNGGLRRKTKYAHMIRMKHWKLYGNINMAKHICWYALYRLRIARLKVNGLGG